MRPLVSVVIPVYNRESYIESCVNSVLNQEKSSCNYEVIVVDDGSTDGSSEVLKKFGNKIHYKRIDNSGRPAVPRNVGISMAKGEYIAFQDSDDLWVPNKLKVQLPELLKSEAALSYGNAGIIDASGNTTGRNILGSNNQFFSGKVFDELVVENYIPTLTTIVRKDVLTDLGGFDESVNLTGVEDYHLWLRIAAKYTVTSINALLAKYRSHDGNISTQNPIISYKRQEEMIKDLLTRQDYFSQDQLVLLKNKLKINRNNIATHSTSLFDKLLWRSRAKF